MKSCKRYLSLLLCCVLSFGLFSFTANAEEIDTSNYKLNYYVSLLGGAAAFQQDILNGEAIEKDISGYVYFEDKDYKTVHRLGFTNVNNEVMFEKDRKYDFMCENLYYQFFYGLPNGSNRAFAVSSWSSLKVDNITVTYTDGTAEYLTKSELDYEIVQNSKLGTMSIVLNDFVPSEDVYKMYFYISHTENPYDNDEGFTSDFKSNLSGFFGTADSGYNLDISVESEEVGLLSGLLEWIKNLWATCESGFANIVKGITELPQKLWTLIEEGLKNLFVPDEQYMTDYSDRWDQLLEDRLGAVYQVCSIVTDSWDNIINADETNTISIPEVSIPLGETTFSFGGEDVKIVPDGFDTLVTALKLVVGIVCTCLFINGLLKRYDEVMGVEQ